jgi:hypothetical protein
MTGIDAARILAAGVSCALCAGCAGGRVSAPQRMAPEALFDLFERIELQGEEENADRKLGVAPPQAHGPA